jgi:nicotinamidase/pyrazinamidase
MGSNRRGLIVVDVQNDFCPGGSLAVPEGDKVVPVINRLVGMFEREGSPVFASRDWHPARTKHFKDSGGVWPPHCVQGTKGAQFHPDLRLPEGTIIVSKGMDPEKDSYSAFDGISGKGESLLALLEKGRARELWVCGLATDYCVKNTALDARTHGFEVALVIDGVRSVNVGPGDGERALREMVARGVRVAVGADA